MYKAIETACAIVNYANDKNRPISNLKLQKVLYFVQGYYLQMMGHEFFRDEIEAWPYGPVVPNVYEQFQQFGANFIPYTNEYSEFDYYAWDETIHYFDINELHDEDIDFLKAVVDKLDKYSASDLVTITHNQWPWKRAIAHGNCTVISKESIKQCFDERAGSIPNGRQ